MADEKRKDARSRKNSKIHLELVQKTKPKQFRRENIQKLLGVLRYARISLGMDFRFQSIFLSENLEKIKTPIKIFVLQEVVSVNATDLMNYAAFYALRFQRQLKAKLHYKNLGFRCAKTSLIEFSIKKISH